MTLTKLAIFAAGYVVGAKAGRERYAQIIDVAGRTSQRLEEFSARHGGDGQDHRPARPTPRS